MDKLLRLIKIIGFTLDEHYEEYSTYSFFINNDYYIIFIYNDNGIYYGKYRYGSHYINTGTSTIYSEDRIKIIENEEYYNSSELNSFISNLRNIKEFKIIIRKYKISLLNG